MTAARRPAPARPVPRIVPVPRDRPLALSFAQQRLWFVAQLDPRGCSLNAPFVLTLEGELDVAALHRALREIVRRHDALRTTFADDGGVPVQRVTAELEVALPIEDLTALAEGERAVAAERLAQREFLTGFDLETGPVFRVRLVRMAGRDHRLLFVAHHLVWDGWSFVVFARELGAIYASLAGGGAAPALPPVVQYPDFAQWERAALDEAGLAPHRAYWRERLAGAPPALDLPADRPRPVALSLRGGRVREPLPAELAGRLRELARRHGVTPFMAMAAGFSALLCRYTGSEDLVIGTVTAGRTRRELESALGVFINTVPLRIDGAGDPSFATLLGRVRPTCIEAFAHQDMPFERLVEQLAPARDPGRMPLFQVLVGQHPAWPGFELPGLSVRAEDAPYGSSMFDLSLVLQDTATTVRATWDFSTALFDEATVRRMHAHWIQLLSAALAEPDRPISQLAMLSDAERHALLVDWNPAAAAPPAACLAELFAAQVARTPDAPAIVFGDVRLTYAELDARANRLARYLAARGVAREDRVGVCLGRSIDFVVSVVAALKAGACYVPLDPSYPADRLAYMAADAGVHVVIARRGAGGEAGAPELSGVRGVTDLAGAWVWLDAIEPELARLSDARLPVTATGRDLAYVMYTSGSTGRPKGTCIEQRSIARLVLGTDYVQLGARDVVAHLSNTSFDAATFEIWGALLNGATLHGIAPEVVVSPEDFARALADGGITALFVTAALFDQVAAVVPRAFHAVHHLIVGGDVVDAASVRRVRAAGPPRRLLNGYGPTETTTFAICHLVGEVDDRATTIPIGRPIANTTVRILDRHRNLVPVGVRGEIYIGGPGVARGYWNRPALTAERFVADPFEPGGRLYRTGDLASWRGDGTIEFHGRADHQIKLRGFRIELGEIEAQLMASAELAAATVVVRDDTGDPRLVAYVVPRAGAATDPDALRARLAAVLPSYMLPSAIVALERLPLTPNGKVDRRALPAPSARRELATAPRTAPRTAMEEIIGEIWQRVLNHDQIGPQDSFFALGGHSLIAMQVLSRLRGVLGISMSVHSLFEAPTLAAFARTVQATMAGGAASSAAAFASLGPVQRPGTLPLSFAQQRLWFLDRLEPDGFSYNVPVFICLTGRLRIDVLAQSLDEIVRRHEVLRTRFVEAGGEPVQVIAPASAVAHTLEIDQLPGGGDASSSASSGAPSDASSVLDAWTLREARRPFSLADGPLVRARLLVLGPDHHVLGLLVHHIVCDGWSIGILMRELQALYRAGLAGIEPALPALPLQYADFAIRQRELSDEILAGQLAYWTEQLAGAPDRIELLTDRARPAVHTTRGALVHGRFTPAVTAAARALSKQRSVTLFMTLLAGYYALLHRYSGHADLVVGTPIAGRHHRELEDLIGFFVNTLALRVRIDERASFDELLASVREVCLRAQAHQDVPFERVVDAVCSARDASRTPLFQVMFVLQDPPASIELPGVTAETLIVHPGMAKVDLTLYVQDTGHELRSSWEYNTDLFDAATVERMAGHYASLLERLLADPAQRPSELPLLSAAERDPLLAQGTVRAPYPAHDSLHALFEAQVARAPDAPAVVFGDARLTYAELNVRANRLARYLAARGVGREDRVGVCLGRSIGFVVSVLATIKAGACYVPLDPSYPVERLAYMAADAGVRVVIARRDAGGEGGATELSNVTDLAGAWVWLDAIEPELAQLSEANPPVIATGEDLAYVMYTSGSTGQPKGTCIEQRSIARLVLGTDYVQLGGRDVVAHLSNTSFDAATFEIWGALLCGATLHGIAPEVAISPEAFAHALADGGVTTVLLTTAVLHQLAAAAPAIFRSLDHVLFGGDVVDAAALRRVLAAGPPRRLINAYGPTEASTIATWHLVGEVDDRATTIPIGRPIANTTVRILDRHRNLVPVGVRGEIYIGGPGVARGYWNRPELTAERFVADPFEPGGRLYRTGDLAAWRGNGTIEFHGRADDQVKLRGFRIELGEIEAQFLAGADLAAATVMIRDDAGDPRLVAYVVPHAGATLDPGAVRARLAAVLPRYMLPSAIVVLERLPMTPNGKVDRRVLPAPSARRELGTAPRTAMEEIVGEIWQRVLNDDQIGPQDSFFALGGHSLIGMQVLSRLRGVLGISMPVHSLFEASTLAGFAREVQARMVGGAAPSVALFGTLGPVARPKALPLSLAQQRLWFLDRLEPGGCSYNVPVFVRLTGPLRLDVLAQSLDEIVRRHEVLRTRFVDTDGAPRQVIAPASAVAHALEVDRLAADADPARSLDAWALREAQRPFSLADGPLVRARLLALGPDHHVLGLTMHHIVCDAWSIGLLMRELQELYRAGLAGTQPTLPALPLQYADFAIRQRALSDEALAGQLAYWTEQLAGAPDRIELPTDRARPTAHTTRGAVVHGRFTPAVTTAVRELSKQRGVTLFMSLLAGFYALLQRYSGQSDLVVGTPITGRHHQELEDLVGFFINTLALRVRIGERASFHELLASVRDACLRGHANQDVAFERVVEAVRPARDASGTPLFQVMFVLQNPPAPIELPGLAADHLWAHPGAAKFDLTLFVEEVGDELRTHWEYNTDLFDAATIERMARHHGALVEAAMARPEAPLRALPLLSEPERRMILEDWNRTQAAPPAQASVVELFEDQVRRTPDAPAVVAGEARLGYRELDARAEQWAAVLRARGCGPGVRVALALSRGPAFPVVVLGVLKAGAAYVPLDPAYPAERLAFMLRDCGARVVVTEAASAAALPASEAEVVLVDAPPEPPVPGAAAGGAGRAAPDDVAYVLYTSGSTGRPKGVAMPHRAMRNLVTWQCARSPAPARTLQFAALSFDVSFQELFATWANGGCVVVAPEEVRRDPTELLRICRARQIERLYLPFVALHQLAEASHGGDLGGLALREVITAGEQLRITPAIAALFARLPACRLYNQYGPTETHVVTEFALTGAPASWDALPPIGRPIANTSAYVLDDELQPAPIGVAGELYIAGDGVARGYIGRAALTSERFIPDPFGPPGRRMYRTGDRAKYLASGDLVFLGRADAQVKVRGYRVEPGEIEAALGSHPAVSEAAVVARSETGDTRLVAYIAWRDGAGRDGAGASVAELRSHLRARLPEYMVPAVIVALPALPLTPSGKLDRRALPKPELERAAYVAPRTAMEEVVSNVWAPVLGVANVGATENFFEAGGHSLLATQVVSRLGAALGVAIPVRALFEAPTIAELARWLEAATGGAHVALPPLDRARRDQPLPLSYAQQRLWFIEQLDPGRFTYNIPLVLRLTGTLDVAALEASLHALVQRHEVLRTRFAEVEGELRQCIADDLAVALEIEPVRDDEVAERARHEALRPFDLGTGPLIRARLLRVRDDEHVLLLVLHHIVCDGWSMAILVRELGAAYLGVVTGAPARLSELAVQYADFAQWQRRWLTGEVLEAQLAYWTRALAGAPPALELPTDRPRPLVRTAHGAQLTQVLGGELATALRALSRKEGATEFMTLLAAFGALLARYSGQHDIVVGSPIAGRNRAELEGLIGFFVNTLVLRVDTAGAPSFRELVGRVREMCLGAYAHQDLPFDKLVEVLKPERELGRTPLFQVMFALQNVPTAELDLAGLVARPVGIHGGIAKFDLSVFVLDGAGELAITWEYNTDLFDAATVERMAAHYASLLERLLADPEQRPAELPLLADAERDPLLAQGTVRAPFPAHAALHALFEAQVARTPDAPAIMFGDARLSYAELDARASRLARYLVARGVGREDRVGVCLGRSVDFVVSVVAAIKAGACYVPLDPSYPVERLAYMTADAGVRVVIARRGAGGEAGASVLTELMNRYELAGAPVWLDAIEPELARLPDADLPVIATGEDLAYVMYTSGSTGQPKGTCVEQRAIARLVLGTDYVQLGGEDVVAHLSNTSFDAATFEIWGALLTGATLYGIAPDVVLSPEALAHAIADGGITAMFVTTALFHQLAAVAPAIFGSVGHVLFGGEQLDAGAVRRVLAAGPPRRLMHVYGPTETTTFATWHLVGESDGRATTIPIGRPIANTTVRILDRHRNLVPVGVRGEIYIGGPGVARGYWNRPELTAERFVADPFEPGGRLYRTGDLAAWRGDGTIEFHGRADGQVKLRGFRIELGEIEAQLLAGAELAAATVVVRDDGGDQRLVAYVVPRAGAALDPDAVRARLAAVLPRYMLPSAIVALDRLPMTPNGKVDRQALPAPSARRDDLGGGYLAPEEGLEQAISRIWAEVLGVDRVGANDNFFDLGGNSLLIVSVGSRIEALLGRPVPVAVLFQHAQVRSLSAHLAGLGRDPSVEPARPAHRTAGARRLADQRRGRRSSLDGHEPEDP